jgi:peroxiredoxin Q/BCP
MLGIGDFAPDIEVTADDGAIFKLSQFRGENVVLYFYPKDDTPGCTKEACDFRDASIQLAKLKAKVFGVSIDDPESHQQFKAKYQLPFTLIADTNKNLSTLFGVLSGDTAARTTFIINRKGKIMKKYQRVKVEGHVEAILEALEELE